MTTFEACNIEPFLYDAAPLDPVSLVDQSDQAGVGAVSPFVPSLSAPQASSSSNQINEQKIEDYLNRLQEAICADMTAIDERLTALEEA